MHKIPDLTLMATRSDSYIISGVSCTSFTSTTKNRDSLSYNIPFFQNGNNGNNNGNNVSFSGASNKRPSFTWIQYQSPKKGLLTTLTILGSFCGCWLPFAAIILLSAFNVHVQIPIWVSNQTNLRNKSYGLGRAHTHTHTHTMYYAIHF